MGHGMASDLEAAFAEFAQLRVVQTSASSQEPGGHKKCRSKTEFCKNGRGRDQVGLAAIVESDCNQLRSRKSERLSDAASAIACIFEMPHLAFEVRGSQH